MECEKCKKEMQQLADDAIRGIKLFKCQCCGAKVELIKFKCEWCGGIELENVREHLLTVHNFDITAWRKTGKEPSWASGLDE
jgi:hypothetical protein